MIGHPWGYLFYRIFPTHADILPSPSLSPPFPFPSSLLCSDRIMVLDGGVLAEMDTPDNLLAKSEEEGVFRSLWERHQRSHGGGNGGMGSKSNSRDSLAALVEGGEEKQQGGTSTRI